MKQAELTDLRTVFRCDGSGQIGFGHVSRCLTIALAFRRRGVTDIQFVTRDLDREVVTSIQTDGHACQLLPADIDEAGDLAAIRAVCSGKRTLVVTDSHDFSRHYYEALHELKVPVVSMDDYAGVAYASDIVINHNIAAQKYEYEIALYTRLLLGTTYFPLREPFRRYSGRRRRVPRAVTSLAVAMGGMPEIEANTKILDGLRDWASEARVRVTAVMGLRAGKEVIREMEALLPPAGRILVNPVDLAALLWSADMAIVNGSLIAYEAAAIGTPLIMAAVDHTQVQNVAGFAQAGIAVTLPVVKELTPAAVAEAVALLAEGPERRQRLAMAGRSIIDGSGVERIVDAAAALGAGQGAVNGRGEKWATK